MTREERLKYCQCCKNRKSTLSYGLVCSLTGAQATFEDGCKDFDEDPIATKEFFYSDDEKKNSRYASIESLVVGLAICCFVVPYVISVVGVAIDGDYSLFWRMAIVTGSFAILGALMIMILYLSRKMRASDNVCELSKDDMLKTLQEEGYFPHKESDGDIVFKIKGTTFTFGTCANGFVYGRLYYSLKKEDLWHAMQAAQDTELSFVAIKVLIHPNSESLIFSVESLCRDKESFRIFVNRALSILSDSVGKFSDKMKEITAEEDCSETALDDQKEKSGLHFTKQIMS